MKTSLVWFMVFILSPFVFAVDINTADAKRLADELYGIGPIKAQRIVEYREKSKGFISIEQLLEVKGIGSKTLERNRDKISISTISPIKPPEKSITHAHSKGGTPSSPLTRATNLDLSPTNEKQSHQVYNRLWDALIIIPLFILCLLIFVVVWLKNAGKDMPVLRTHLVSTVFVCSGCGKVSNFKNVRHEGHFSEQYLDGDLPPGWSCIENWQGKPCDYCFDCSVDNCEL